ncbi:MAG: LPS-assembly protein LptD [Candidatus Omnitrophota bacterium]
MLRDLKIRILLVFVITFCLATLSFAQDEDLLKLKPGQPIIVNGDKVEYFEEDNRIVAEGNVSITYGDIKLTCDKIEVNTKTQQALCQGNVRIDQPEGFLTGDRIRYNFAKREGEIIGGEVKAYPWFGRAEETGKVAKNEYLLREGYVTTCDLDEPHYRITAKEIRVFPDDKVIAKNVVIYIDKVPVLWFPYYYHPIIQSRAKVQFIPGWNSDWGYFLLSAWRFYVKGNTKVDVLLDYRHKKGFAEGADFYYFCDDLGLKGWGEGLFRMYYIQQNEAGTVDPTAFRDENDAPEPRNRLQWKHRIDFDPETVGMLEFNKLSDEFVLKDYFYNEFEEAGQIPRNFASIISSKPNYITEISTERKFNDFTTVAQTIPKLKMDIPDQRLWETTIYYGGKHSFNVFDKQYAFEKHPPEKVKRFDTFHKLSYVAKAGPVNLTPFGTFRETLYSRNKWEGDVISRETIGGGLDMSTRFHRIYDIETDAAGLDIHKIRHLIVPSAKYFTTHQPTVDKDSLFQMDEIDSLEKENGVTLSLENKLQTKRGSEGKEKPVDLVRFIVSTDYLFRMEKDKFKFKKEGKFENLAFDLELRPYEWFFVDSQLEIERKNQSVKKGYIEASVEPFKGLRLDAGYRYEKLTPRPRNQFTFDLNYTLNPKWKVGWYERLNLERGIIEEQQISVTRDLHCWELEFVYDVDGSNFIKDDFTIWLAFKIKAFPDLQLGLSRSFKTRPPGSIRD